MIIAKLKPLALVWTIALSALVVADAGAAKVRSGGGSGPGSAIGPTVTINNGVVGDGGLEVTLGAGGEDDLAFDPLGPDGLTSLLFELNHYVDVGADGGAVQLGATTITQLPTITGPNQVTSAGNFVGANGTINWTAVSTIAPGSTTYRTTLTFTSTAPFGVVRLIQYMDADVDDFSADNIVLLGAFGSPGFGLLTTSTSRRLGPAQRDPVLTNATCPGWAASEFDELRSAIEGAGTTYTPAGNVFGLPPITDLRYRFPTWGPADMTSAVACDLAPGATSATIVFSISAEDFAAVPTLSQWAVIVMVALLVGAAMWRLRRRSVLV